MAGMNYASNAMNKVAFSCLICISSTAFAQTPTQSPVEPTLKSVVVSAPSARQQIEIGGMQQPLNQAPLSATVISSEQIKETGAQRLSDLYKLDASVSDAYNAVGYIDYATVRGFVIDNKTNIRRDGLPISGDTAIGLANKDRIEILRGTSGLQAGTSAPGGLMNYIVKRPTAKPLRQLGFSVDSNGQFGASVDLGGRFGAENAQGYRLNFAANRLNSTAPQTRGSRQMLALALDSRMGSNGLLEAEIEWSKQSQPNVPGLSLLGAGAVLPQPDPKLNLNRQAWSQPTVFEGLTGSLRYTHALSDQWQWSAHLGSQRLKTDDRIAFPFGCTDSNGIDYYADRFCPNGDVDVYDFRSEGERRRKQATQFKLDGSFATGNVSHDISLGFLQSAARVKTPDQVFNGPIGSLNLSNPVLPLTANPQPAL
ncbi:MAG: TonB-dependent receptor plug domain-containing protein, partial [Brachymonas sp.]|nr:TonB-dependent receptor plug domain-containing protein [Brachymonas sp.]